MAEAYRPGTESRASRAICIVHSRPERIIRAAIRSRGPVGSAPTPRLIAFTARAPAFFHATGAIAVGEAAAAASCAALTPTTAAVGRDISRDVGDDAKCSAGAWQRRWHPSAAALSRPPNVPAEPGSGSGSGCRWQRYRLRRHPRRRWMVAAAAAVVGRVTAAAPHKRRRRSVAAAAAAVGGFTAAAFDTCHF